MVDMTKKAPPEKASHIFFGKADRKTKHSPFRVEFRLPNGARLVLVYSSHRELSLQPPRSATDHAA